MRWLLGWVTCGISFVYLVVVLNSIQMLSVVVYPFSQRLFRRINRWAARSIWGIWVLIAERQHGTEVRFVGDRVPWGENALVVANHQSMADVLILLSLGWRCGRLGDLKFFVKDQLKYVPGVGWGMKFLDCVFVRRTWTQDKAGIERLFRKYKARDIPVLLISFLEGTRKTDAKLQRARAFAAERGLHVPAHTLVPRTKGFVASVYGLRDHLQAVYDVTIAYPDRIPGLFDCFLGRVARVDVDVRRVPIETLPTEEAALERWVYDCFAKKDERLQAFAEHDGRLPGPVWSRAVRMIDWLRSDKVEPAWLARLRAPRR